MKRATIFPLSGSTAQLTKDRPSLRSMTHAELLELIREKYSDRRVLFALTLITASLLALVTAVVAYSSSSAPSAEEGMNEVLALASAPPAQELSDVLLALAPIERNRPLDASLFAVVRREQATLAPGHITSLAMVQGKYAKALIPPGVPLHRDLITATRPANEVIASIPAGHRALSIKVDATSAVEGWAQAGASVDVHWVSEVSGKKTVSLLVPNARVVSAERRVEGETTPGSSIPTVVTLLVSDDDAQRIVLASTGGKLVLHLRGLGAAQGAAQSTGAISIDELVGGIGKHQQPNDVQGIVTLKNSKGELEEWAVIDGELRRRKQLAR